MAGILALGANIDQNLWPQCGEIDMMEYKGHEPNIIHGSVHGPGYSGSSLITKSYGLQYGRFNADFHVYAIEWSEDYLHYFADDVIHQEITSKEVESKGDWVYDHPSFIILNLAVGGNYVGFPAVETVFPQTIEVDWVQIATDNNLNYKYLLRKY